MKNVTGFDLCRLLVGSLGTLGLLAEVVLRCHPVPGLPPWFVAGEGADPFDLHRRLFRPSSILWDGRAVWVLLEGHPADVADQAAQVLGAAFAEAPGPPEVPAGGRRSLPPGRLPGLPRERVAGRDRRGDGAHRRRRDRAPRRRRGRRAWRRAPPRRCALQAALKARFDPTGRLNPGRRVW